MSRTTRQLRGWPPESTTRPASGAELARARQTGQTVKQLRQEQARYGAAEQIALMLKRDADPQDTFHGVLCDRDRWALHLAEWALKDARLAQRADSGPEGGQS